MKRGILNYSLTYNEDNNSKEEIFFSKLDMITAYIHILTDEPRRNISSLRVWEVPKAIKPAEDITGRINRFLYQ